MGTWDDLQNKNEEYQMGLNYEVGDIVTLKKAHPCGSKEWEILRVGADFRLKCKGCGHQIMVARKLVEKNTRDLKKIEKSACILETLCYNADSKTTESRCLRGRV